MHEKAFNETFYFASIDDVIVVPSEKIEKMGLQKRKILKVCMKNI